MNNKERERERLRRINYKQRESIDCDGRHRSNECMREHSEKEEEAVLDNDYYSHHGSIRALLEQS